MQKYRSFASFRHKIIIELQYYLGMPLEEAIESTRFSVYLRGFREMRDFFDYRNYGPQSYIFKNGEHIFMEKSSRLKQAP